MSDNLISIIIPAYNCGNTIIKTIESIEKQSFRNYEIIIINDGSKDDTLEIIKEKSKKNNKIRWKTIENSGVSVARNIGMEIAKGKYIMFADSDDIYDTDMLSIMINQMETNNVELLSCGYKKVTPKEVKNVYCENKLYDDIFEFIEESQTNELLNIVWNKIYIKNIISDNKIEFNANIDLGEDLCFNIDYIKKCKKIMNISQTLYIYNCSSYGLNYKFRKDIFDIKRFLYKYQEKLYIDRNQDLQYMYRLYIKNCYSSLIKITNKKNGLMKEEKIKILSNIIGTCQRDNIKIYVKDKKHKLLIYNFLINSMYLYIFGCMLNIIKKG